MKTLSMLSSLFAKTLYKLFQLNSIYSIMQHY